jgi:hypothetical protein
MEKRCRESIQDSVTATTIGALTPVPVSSPQFCCAGLTPPARLRSIKSSRLRLIPPADAGDRLNEIAEHAELFAQVGDMSVDH